MTLSGHLVEYAVQQMGIENQGLPYRTDALLLTVRIRLLAGLVLTLRNQ